MLLKLGEAGILHLLLGTQVLSEIEHVLRRKAPQALSELVLLLDRSRVQVVPKPDMVLESRCRKLVDHPGDARVLAEAWAGDCDYLATLDKNHFLDNKLLNDQHPFAIGTPGDCLAWLREHFRHD